MEGLPTLDVYARSSVAVLNSFHANSIGTLITEHNILPTCLHTFNYTFCGGGDENMRNFHRLFPELVFQMSIFIVNLHLHTFMKWLETSSLNLFKNQLY